MLKGLGEVAAVIGLFLLLHRPVLAALALPVTLPWSVAALLFVSGFVAGGIRRK